jgi:hypothetical protein
MFHSNTMYNVTIKFGKIDALQKKKKKKKKEEIRRDKNV